MVQEYLSLKRKEKLGIRADAALVAAFNAALDAAKDPNETEKHFAERIGISGKTLTFWRKGLWTTHNTALISVCLRSKKDTERAA